MGAILRVGPEKLWLPGKIKPQGIPKIDWSHPLTRKLITYWCDTGLGFYLDLVTGDVTTVMASNSLPAVDSSAYGIASKFVTLQHGIQGAIATTQQTWTAPYSGATGWLQRGAVTNNGLGITWWGFSDASGNQPYILWSADAVNIFHYFGNAAGNGINTGAIPAAGSFNVAVGVATGSNAQSGYLNGVLGGTGTQASNYSGANLRSIFCQTRSGGTNGMIANSSIFFSAAWGRALDAQEAMQLYLDPYCFLIPATMAQNSSILALSSAPGKHRPTLFMSNIGRMMN